MADRRTLYERLGDERVRRARVDAELVGENIRSARGAAGLNKQQLAERLGVSPAAVGQYERGKSMPSVSTFAAIAEVLGVSYGVLFGEPFATAEHLVAGVREQVRALGYDLALIPRDTEEGK